MLFLITFEEEMPEDMYEDDVYDEILVGCVAKVITRGNLQDENGQMHNILNVSFPMQVLDSSA